MKHKLMAFALFLRAWFEQTFIAADQLVNAALGPLFSWTIGWADETLSARAWRCRDKPWGRVMRPVIDLLFVWQGPGHCRRAYETEIARRNLHPEYRQARS
jgi:hypothetical protein